MQREKKGKQWTGRTKRKNGGDREHTLEEEGVKWHVGVGFRWGLKNAYCCMNE